MYIPKEKQVTILKDVNSFLQKFSPSKTIGDVFGSDCCYWFAAILFGRFIRDGATIMYDKTANHFGTRINGKVYDITGDVTSKYQWIPWDSAAVDDSLRASVTKISIMFN